MMEDQKRMQLVDTYYDKVWASKSKSIEPLASLKHKNINVDLKWPDDGKGKQASLQRNIATKIGVDHRNQERGLLQSDQGELGEKDEV
jgi:hypothetical protein